VEGVDTLKHKLQTCASKKGYIVMAQVGNLRQQNVTLWNKLKTCASKMCIFTIRKNQPILKQK